MPSAAREPVEAPKPAPPAASPDAEAAAEASIVDFETQIQPLLEQHCYGCHSATMMEGGLRLDMKHLAIKGGDSGEPIVGGTLETNELYRRVTVSDESERMPLGEEPLGDAEIALIRAWVEQGTTWPDSGEGPPENALPPAASPPGGAGRSNAAASTEIDESPPLIDIFIEQARAFENLQILLFGAAAFVLSIAMLEAARSRFGESQSIRRSTYLPAALLVGALCVLVFLILRLDAYHRSQHVASQNRLVAHKQELARRIAYLESVAREQGLNIDAGKARKITDIFGLPPVPPRPNHSRRLHGSYYRGNCERNHKLFNYGNYLTATFHVGLCDKQGRLLEYNDAVPQDGLFVKFELVRAPNTAPALYSETIMGAVELANVYEESPEEGGPGRVPLEVVEPEQKWEAYFPIDLPDDFAAGETSHSELIYVYKGKMAHYGIKCDLVLKGGRIAEESEVWMGNLFLSGRIATPEAGKIPVAEWFDDRPLPAITGENTTDPKLLGVPEHVPGAGKGEEGDTAPAQAAEESESAQTP